jgi:prephenate dehydratase
MSNTATACAIVAGRTDAVAIANQRAAELHGLEILKPGVGNDANLTTRYVVVSKVPADLGPRTNLSHRKQSLALTVRNEAGSIFKMLSPFAFRGINVLKLVGIVLEAQLPFFARFCLA